MEDTVATQSSCSPDTKGSTGVFLPPAAPLGQLYNSTECSVIEFPVQIADTVA